VIHAAYRRALRIVERGHTNLCHALHPRRYHARIHTQGRLGAVDWDAHRLSFGPAAGLYDRVRPRYPVEALRWMLRVGPRRRRGSGGQKLGDQPRRVVDLGAGTGILTRQLLQLGHDVIPIEPDAGMRAKLDDSLGREIARDGSAEHIPIADGDADAVVAGQAYHWFNRDLAHDEIARVLRTGGVFAPVWNERDDQVDWLRRLSEITHGIEDDAKVDERHLDGELGFGPRFTPVEQATFPFVGTSDEQLLIELMQSRSYYLSGTAKQQQRMTAEIRQLVREHPDLAGRTEFPLPYVTYAYRAHKR
jgi:SAM-dependent methyltransferase